MKIYEYKTYNISLNQQELNVLGSEGWLLISHTAVSRADGIGKQYYVFVRHSDTLL